MKMKYTQKKKKLDILSIYFKTKNTLYAERIIYGDIFYKNYAYCQIFNNF